MLGFFLITAFLFLHCDQEKIAVPAESIKEDQKEADNSATEVDGHVSKETLVQSVNAASQPTGSTNSLATFASAAYLLFKNRKLVPSLSAQTASEGSAVDPVVVGSEQGAPGGSNEKAHDAEDIDESSGYEDAPSDFSPGSSTPDGSSDAALPEDEESELKNSNVVRDVKDPDACLLS